MRIIRPMLPLLAVLICCASVTAEQNDESQADSSKTVTTENNTTDAQKKANPDWFEDDSTTKNSDLGLAEDTDYTSQLLVTVLLIIILGSIALYLSKKVGPKLSARSSQNISVCESVNLSPGKTLHIVDIKGNGKVLISSTSSNINMLMRLEENSTMEEEA